MPVVHVYGEVAGGCGARQGGGMATCPECDFEIDVDEYDVDRGDTLECDNCGVTLEVVGLNPIEFEAVSDDDDEDDDDFEEDDERDDDDDDEGDVDE
jgi:alpha-aminoadipate/glutamate carrier protein LysW